MPSMAYCEFIDIPQSHRHETFDVLQAAVSLLGWLYAPSCLTWEVLLQPKHISKALGFIKARLQVGPARQVSGSKSTGTGLSSWGHDNGDTLIVPDVMLPRHACPQAHSMKEVSL